MLADTQKCELSVILAVSWKECREVAKEEITVEEKVQR